MPSDAYMRRFQMMAPGRHKAIIWTNAGILTEPSGINFGEISIKILAFSFKKMHLKMSAAKWGPSFVGLNVLKSLLADRCFIT